MPLEIKELVIRAVLEEAPDLPPEDRTGDAAPAEKSAIVEECVREVLKILERTRER